MTSVAVPPNAKIYSQAWVSCTRAHQAGPRCAGSGICWLSRTPASAPPGSLGDKKLWSKVRL